MKLRMSKHFEDRVQDRGLNIDHVKKAIKEPDNKENIREGRFKVEKKIEGKTIRVVYYKEGFRDKKNHFILVTAYYL